MCSLCNLVHSCLSSMVSLFFGLYLEASAQHQTAPQPREEPSKATRAEDILEAIRRGGRPQDDLKLLPPVERQSASSPGLLPEGSPIANRVARLSKEGQRWVLVLGDGAGDSAPPMLALECRMLERMVRQCSDGSNPVYVVSGIVTEYEGRNGLFVLNALQRSSSGLGSN